MPVSRLETSGWTSAPRMPLGDAYRGHCHADAAEIFEPAEADQHDLCNCGYARGRCSRFPPEAEDAVRFSVTQDRGGIVRLTWITEKSHSPSSFGSLEYSIPDAELAGSAAILIAAQARAFLDSYLNRAQR